MREAKQLLRQQSLGFRTGYLDHDQLTQQLERWAQRYPDLLRLESLGHTPEGRPLWLAIVGQQPERLRPAFWLNANMHASELVGSSVALGLIEDLLELHLCPTAPPHAIPGAIAEVARDLLFYVMPRMTPDGAEAVLKQGRRIRSVPRDTRHETRKASWRGQDMDGDGLSLMLRYRDDAGEFVEAEEQPGLMLRRELGDSGPYYQLAVEGLIDNFDGVSIPESGSFDDHFPDLNRNFPWAWVPEPDQEGAGVFPTSEPECRAVVEFATRHPNIFAWADLHSFGGVFIRPLGHAPDAQMHEGDLSLYNQLAAWAKEFTGYPTVSGYSEFTYSPEQPLHGDIIDFAYHQRGAFAYTCELWDLFARLGLPRPTRFAEHYVRLGRAELIKLWEWDREHNEARIFRPWKPVAHPQLGEVEVGGIDPRIGVWNPPERELAAICRGQAELMLHVAAMAPRVHLRCADVTRLGSGLWQASVVVENLGYLPSHVLASAKRGPLADPPRLELRELGCELLSPSTRSLSLEHLAGWGRGLYGPSSSMLSMKSSGSSARHHLRVTLRGNGGLLLRLSSPRLGIIETTLNAPGES